MKRIIHTERAPLPIGAYSQAVKFGHMLYISGQIPVDPQTGILIKGDIGKQTIQALENLKALLETAGATLNDVVKTTVFLADMADFSEFNKCMRSTLEKKTCRRVLPLRCPLCLSAHWLKLRRRPAFNAPST